MFLLLFAVWLILNGKVTAEICLLGLAVSAALFVFLCRCMDYSLKKELLLFRLAPFLAGYLGVLIREIVQANVNVLRLILSPELEPEPAMIYFDPGLTSPVLRTVLANSITLTPGTITVSAEGDLFCVHCLDRGMGEGLEDSAFVRLLKRMEEERKKWKL